MIVIFCYTFEEYLINQFFSQKGFFKGMAFSHVIKNYVIHGGNSQGLGAAEDWISKGKLHRELITRFASFKLPLCWLILCLFNIPINLCFFNNTARSMKHLCLELRRLNTIARDLSFLSRLHQYQI